MNVCFTALALLMLGMARANVEGRDDRPPPLVLLLGMAGLNVEGGDDAAGTGFPSEVGGSRGNDRYRALYVTLRWRWRVLRLGQLRLSIVEPLPYQFCFAEFIFILWSTVIGPDVALEHRWMMAMVVLPLFIVEGGPVRIGSAQKSGWGSCGTDLHSLLLFLTLLPLPFLPLLQLLQVGWWECRQLVGWSCQLLAKEKFQRAQSRCSPRPRSCLVWGSEPLSRIL